VTVGQPSILSAETRLAEGLLPFIQENLRQDCLLVWVTTGVTVPQAEDAWGVRIDDLANEQTFSRTVLVVEGIPLDMQSVSDWRERLLREVGPNVRCFYFVGDEDPTEVTGFLQQGAEEVFRPPHPPEEKGIGVGEWVKAPPPGTQSPSHMMLTMFFDSLGELLGQMDGIRHRFRDVAAIPAGPRKQHRKDLSRFLTGASGSEKELAATLNRSAGESPDKLDLIPRVLLLGETGVGKTAFANYLGERGEPVTRLSVAEFVNKEDMFEYALFGYKRGAYTHASEPGRAGILLENLGGVVFLDEIGSATPAIQAKLLAFLDDFRVRPRGADSSLFCPVLIVAATNEDIRKTDRYRNDLFQRFTDVHVIPPLRELKHNFRYIVDAILQKPGINADHGVRAVGNLALNRLLSRDYTEGNFRELQNALRKACHNATTGGRDHIVEADIPNP
jgi:hypothetical protein